MSVVLADHKKYSCMARRGAALQLKWRLRSKDPVVLNQQQMRWKIVPTDVREMIKSNVLIALSTASLIRPSNATEMAACIAAAELPLKDNWPDLMPTLSDYVVHLPDEEKESALEAMAFVCQDMVLIFSLHNQPLLLISNSLSEMRYASWLCTGYHGSCIDWLPHGKAIRQRSSSNSHHSASLFWTRPSTFGESGKIYRFQSMNINRKTITLRTNAKLLCKWFAKPLNRAILISE